MRIPTIDLTKDGFSQPKILGYTPRVVSNGWKCPECSRIWAPHVESCSCTQQSFSRSFTGVPWNTWYGDVSLGHYGFPPNLAVGPS